MNVLLTGSERHTLLSERFHDALNGSGKVFVAVAASMPTAPRAESVVRTPSADHPAYLNTLLAFCKRERVSLLVPLGSAELLPLARATATGWFKAVGTRVAVPSEAVVRCCHDRWALFRHLCFRDIRTPKTYRSLVAARTALEHGDLGFPVVVKARWRNAALSPELCYDETELELSYRRAQRRLTQASPTATATRSTHATLIQAFVGGDEYGFDVVNDLSGSYVTTFARKKLGVRAGETDSAVTTESGTLGALGKVIGTGLKHTGSLEGDAIATDEARQELWLLGLTPHLGDGYAFSHAAGANLPAALIAWARGEVPNAVWLQPRADVVVARYSSVTRVP